MAEVRKGMIDRTRNWSRALVASAALAPTAIFGSCASGNNNATEQFSVGVECSDPNANLLVLKSVMGSRFAGEVHVTCEQNGEQNAPKSLQLLEGSGSTEVIDSSTDLRAVLKLTARYTKGGMSGQNPKISFMTPDTREEKPTSGVIEVLGIHEITRAEVVTPPAN